MTSMRSSFGLFVLLVLVAVLALSSVQSAFAVTWLADSNSSGSLTTTSISTSLLTATPIPSDNEYFDWMLEIDHFKIYFHSSDAEFAGGLIRVGEEDVFSPLLKVYGGAPPNKTAVYLFLNFEEAKKLGSFPSFIDPGSSFGGFDTSGPLGDGVKLYFPEKDKALSPMTESFMKFTMAHEVGHRFFYFVYPNIRAPIRPNWLDEGLAMYVGIEVSQQVEFAFRPVVQSVKTGQPPLAELDALDKLQESRSTLDLYYGEAATVIYFISTSYGEQALKQILVEYNRSKNLHEAFKQVLGVTYSDFEKAWINRIRDIGEQANSGTEFYCVLTEKTPSTTVVPTPTSTSTSIQEQPQPSQFPVPIILMIVVAILIIALFVIRRKRKKRRLAVQKPIPIPLATPALFVCPHCRRDLSALPKDLAIRPYCGKPVSISETKTKPVREVELPLEVQRIRRYARMTTLFGILVAVSSFILIFLGGLGLGRSDLPAFPILRAYVDEYIVALWSVVFLGVLLTISGRIIRTDAGTTRFWRRRVAGKLGSFGDSAADMQ